MVMPTKYVHTTDLHNTKAAEAVIPLILELVKPKSVVDVGCGLGTWLYVFRQHGIDDVLGVEGSHLNKSMLVIPEHQVHIADLEKPLHLSRRFDLCVSLEVGEHLSGDVASTFVASLCGLSDIILFSAAIPGQGGQNHINEQWYDYWQSKFEAHEYKFYDVLRSMPAIWNNPDVEWWYKQNMFLVAREGALPGEFKPDSIRNYIHPELLAEKVTYIDKCMNGKLKPQQYLKLFAKSLIKS